MPLNISGRATGSMPPQAMGGQAQQTPTPQGEDAGGSMPDEGEGEMATPAEQAQYDKFVSKSRLLIYSDKMLPKVRDMLRTDDPREGLAQVAASTVFRVIEMASKAGEKIMPDVLLHAGKEVFEDLAQLATEDGVHDFQADKKALDGAFYRAMDHLRLLMSRSGMINQQKQKELLAALQEMDQSGELKTGFEGLNKPAAGAAPQADAPPVDDAEPMPDEEM